MRRFSLSFFLILLAIPIAVFLFLEAYPKSIKPGENQEPIPKLILNPSSSLAITVQIDTTSAGPPPLPYGFWLDQNYPNPLNPSTLIKYSCGKEVYVTIKIYNILGQEVTTLVSGKKSAGVHQIWWDGKNEQGKPLASGLYLYQIKAGPFVQSKKLLILR